MTKRKKIHYIFHGRFPSEKAHGLFAAKTCEAFYKEGYEVDIIVPNRRHENTTPQEYYKLETPLPVTYIPTLDFIHKPYFKYFSFYLSHTLFSFGVRRYLKKNADFDDIVYTNEALSLPWFPKKYRVCYELHDFPQKRFWWYRWLFGHADHILITNNWKTKEFKKYFPELAIKTFTEINAVDVEDFDITLTKKEARTQLALPLHKKIVVYTGHLYGWKGVHTLAKAASNLPEDFVVYFVGGHPHDIEKFRAHYETQKNIIVAGHRPHEEMPVWQKAADVLVIPNTAKEAISKYHTSPMKLFEYMAGDTSVVASDISSIREVAGDNTVYYVEPDNDEKLAAEIVRTVDTDSTQRIRKAKEKVSEHTWNARAKRIVRYID